MAQRPQSMVSGRVLPERPLQTLLARTLFSAERDQRTAVLTVDEGAVQTQLHLKRGVIEYASQGALAETLGRLLIREGTIDRSEYLLILELMAKPTDKDEVSRFGEVAIQHGMLSATDLHDALALQIREKLEHCLFLEDALWTWDDTAPEREGLQFPTQLAPVVLGAVRQEGERWRNVLWPLRECTVHLVGSAYEATQGFQVQPAEVRLLRDAEGRAIGELLRSPKNSPNDVSAMLVALSAADRLSFMKPRVPTIPPPAPPERSKTSRAREAAGRLREEMRRRRAQEPSTPKGRLDAERCFERGRDLLGRGLYLPAKESFMVAVEQMPEAAEYVLHLRWCEWVAEEGVELKAAYEVHLRAAILEALRQDRRMAFAHYLQGRLYLHHDDEEAAEKAFFRATRLDRSDKESARYLRLLQGRRES